MPAHLPKKQSQQNVKELEKLQTEIQLCSVLYFKFKIDTWRYSNWWKI